MTETIYKFQGTDDYIIDDELKMTMNIAIGMNKPLLVKGEPGTGKSASSPPRTAAWSSWPPRAPSARTSFTG